MDSLNPSILLRCESCGCLMLDPKKLQYFYHWRIHEFRTIVRQCSNDKRHTSCQPGVVNSSCNCLRLFILYKSRNYETRSMIKNIKNVLAFSSSGPNLKIHCYQLSQTFCVTESCFSHKLCLLPCPAIFT